MSEHMTVGDALEKAREHCQQRRCPECGAGVSVRGIGEYWWECLECDAVGIGYTTRSGAVADINR